MPCRAPVKHRHAGGSTGIFKQVGDSISGGTARTWLEARSTNISAGDNRANSLQTSCYINQRPQKRVLCRVRNPIHSIRGRPVPRRTPAWVCPLSTCYCHVPNIFGPKSLPWLKSKRRWLLPVLRKQQMGTTVPVL